MTNKEKIILPILIITASLVFIIFYTLKNKTSDERTSLTDEMTFCEKIIYFNRMISSADQVLYYDTMPDEYMQSNSKFAPINFNGKFPDAKRFITRISEAYKDGPNFAGHYTVATWGCGSGCQNSAVIDNETGEIIDFGIESSYGLDFNLDSKILITNPKKSFPDPQTSGMTSVESAMTFSYLDRRYYVISRNEYINENMDENTVEIVREEPRLTSPCVESAASHYDI